MQIKIYKFFHYYFDHILDLEPLECYKHLLQYFHKYILFSFKLN